ncbi:hypothetical protein KW534_04085 [Vibrio fluvialis]|nr:hypothetical protein [Vibrio fluvialis]MBY8259734.1 hypothetical protein [Vibrio fluvialis]MBY8302260.1 hypothetical protein [Vibrio fluvialis]
MKKYNLNENYEFVGLWSTPTDPEQLIPGVLKYNAETGINLELEGSFSGEEFNIIHGHASGVNITVVDCFSTSWTMNLGIEGMYAPSKIVGNKIIVGTVIESLDELILEHVVLETSDIKPWSKLSGFSKPLYDDINERRKFSLTYKLPDEKIFYSDEEVDIGLNCSLNFPSTFPLSEDLVFRESNSFKITNKVSKGGLFHSAHVDAIRKFISLATRTDVSCRSIKMKLKDHEPYVFILANLIPINLDYKAKKLSDYDMFFTLTEVEERIQELYSKWFIFYCKSPESINLYFYKTKGWQHDIFLTKAQALEEAHRQINPGTNKWGYQSRVEALFNKFCNVMAHTGDAQAFSNIVKDHRDYYSHWFEKKRNKVSNGLILGYLSRDVNLLLEMMLLNVIGFDETEILKIVENCMAYRSYLEIGREHYPSSSERRHLWASTSPIENM